jgi:hypothetical protein
MLKHMPTYIEAEQRLNKSIFTRNEANLIWIQEALVPVNELAKELSLDVVLARLQEWHSLGSSVERSHVKLQERRVNGYFAAARHLQEEVDSKFRTDLPWGAEVTAQAITELFGDKQTQWSHVTYLVDYLSEILHEPTREDYKSYALAIEDIHKVDYSFNGLRRIATQGNELVRPEKMMIYGRAKADFSIFQKMLWYRVFPDEIFDVLGIQVIAESDDHAFNLAKQLLLSGCFKLMKEHPFRLPIASGRRTDLIHNPSRNYLRLENTSTDSPEHSSEGKNFRAWRLNFVFTPPDKGLEVPFEVQFTPYDSWKLDDRWLDTVLNRKNKT